jgi:hypothetical protein
VCAGQPGYITQEMDKQQARLDVSLVCLLVDGKIDFHALPPRKSL